jgi:hypothetical protein
MSQATLTWGVKNENSHIFVLVENLSKLGRNSKRADVDFEKIDPGSCYRPLDFAFSREAEIPRERETETDTV